MCIVKAVFLFKKKFSPFLFSAGPLNSLRYAGRGTKARRPPISKDSGLEGEMILLLLSLIATDGDGERRERDRQRDTSRPPLLRPAGELT